MIGCPLACPLGGGPDDIEVEQDALLEALADGLDPTAPEQIAQTHGEALALAIVWAVDRRRRGQLDPHRMLEPLPDWERASGLRPGPDDTENARRAALAAQFLGIAGNTLSALSDICTTLAGPSFLGFYLPGPDAPSYTPGLCPGPPGFDTASMRAVIGVRLQPVGQSDATFLALVRTLTRRLAATCPDWMVCTIGTDEGGMTADVATCDQTLLDDA